MKRIFTPFAVICMLATLENAKAQSGCATTESFQASTTNTFSQGVELFSGDINWDSNGMLALVNGTKTLTSPAFQLSASQADLFWGFDLVGNGAKINDWTAAITLADNTGTPQQVCSGSSLSDGSLKFKVSIPVAFKGKSIRIKFTFNITSPGNSNKNVTIDNFITNTSSGITLPVNFTGLQARKSGTSTQVTWNVAQEEGVISYSVEKSTDGINYAKIGTVAATGSSSYTFADNQAASGTAFYRVKSIDKDGQYRYSTIVKLDGSKVSFIRNAYPMPATTEVNIQHNAAPAGTIMTLTSQDGRLVQRLQVQNGSMQTRIDLSSLKPGMYLVRFDNDTNNTEPLKIIKQ